MGDGPDTRSGEDLARENAELRRQLEDFLFHLPDALVESDVVAQRVVSMNRMAQVLFGYGAEDVQAGISGSAVFAPGEEPRAREFLKAYVARSLATLDNPAGFSLGVAFRRSGEKHDQALARADRTMYAARGRRLRRPRRPAGPSSGETAS